MNHQELIEKVCEFDKQGLPRRAVQLLLDTVDTWMHNGLFDECENLLKKADPTELSVTTSIGILAAVYPIAEQIRESRSRFVSLFRLHLENTRPGDVDDLMNGIKP